MVPDADPSHRLAGTRRAVERDAQELRARAYAARAKIVAALSSITEIRQMLSAMLPHRRERSARNGAGPYVTR
jgi:hypothetical protein